MEEKESVVDLETIVVNDNNKHVCVVCQSLFESRNKLFEHIKAEGHAVLKPSVVVNNNNQSMSHNAAKRNKRLGKILNKK